MFTSLGVKRVVRIKTAWKGNRLHEHEPGEITKFEKLTSLTQDRLEAY
jgi:hypothetical protein